MALVKQLREASGAPITECKDAVAQAVAQSSSHSPPPSDSDLLSLATDLLRKKGVSTASKKSGRTANEGLVAVAVNAEQTRAAVVELNSETDFAARNERFQATLQSITRTALTALQPSGVASDEAAERSAVAALLAAQSEGKSVQDVLTDTVTVLRENIQLRRATALAVDGQGAIGVYVHNAVAPSSSSHSSPSSARLGRTVAAVALSFHPTSSSSSPSSASSLPPLASLAHKLAMQVTAASPTFLSIPSIPASTLSHERSILLEQAQAKSPNSKHLQRIIDGKVQKWYEDVVMLEQRMVVSVGDEEGGGGGEGEAAGKVRVREVLEREGKRRGGKVEVVGFVKYTVGEGVKKDEAKLTFAEEVASKLS